MAHILIIEDSENDRLIAKRFLTDAGYQELVFSETGEDGVAKAGSEVPDLVITDTILPGIDGFEVCQKIREALGDTVKIIIMTGSVDAVDAVKARRMGADDYVVKSGDPALLLEAVKRLI
ncbi:MAG: response regulator [Deltaproteobacteria bacterium]|nr:response regulator [Deltaproteobacteria bacterium]